MRSLLWGFAVRPYIEGTYHHATARFNWQEIFEYREQNKLFVKANTWS